MTAQNPSLHLSHLRGGQASTMSDTSKTIFFNIHVPKTAGWMFWNILEANFGNNLKGAYFPAQYEITSPEGVEWMLRQYDRFTCYTSHCFRLSSMPILNGHEIVAFSFIRNPIERFLSHYFYTRASANPADGFPTKKYNLDQFVDQLLEDRHHWRPPLDVPQDEFIRGHLAESDFAQYLSLGFGTYHLFATEYFDEAMILLENMYPDSFKDCSYGAKVNQSKRDQEVTPEILRKIARLPWIERDSRLHDFSMQYSEDLVKKVFNTPEEFKSARDNWLRRCRQKEKSSSKKIRKLRELSKSWEKCMEQGLTVCMPTYNRSRQLSDLFWPPF